MNILADEQLKILDPALSESERKKLEDNYYKLYYQLREKDENSILGRMSLKTRKRLHWLVLLVYTIKNRLGGFSHEIINDRRTKSDRPIIFALTHVGKFDIEVVSEGIKDHYYLLSGDYEHLQGTLDAPFLALNGVFYFNENVKEDRIAVTQKMIRHLKNGGNLMYFPEGTWNLSPNLPLLPCYWGIVEIAQKSNSIIVPVAAEQYGKHFRVNIGFQFDMNLFGNKPSEKSDAITNLRDILATLKYEIWESEPQVRRKDLQGHEWDEYVEERFKEWPYFNLDYVDRLIYKPKNVVPAAVAFEHLSEIQPSRNTAFLFNKRLIPRWSIWRTQPDRNTAQHSSRKTPDFSRTAGG
jgi:lysophospholipid acyltransferase (LPLAT)-like uncharacterized protein